MTQPELSVPADPPKPALEVLVVDDNPATRYATARVMRAAGFTTHEVATGREALDQARGSMAAVILDVHLPDIDGFEVCRLLRLAPDTARLPVVHLSGAYVQNDDKVRGLDLGADAYMIHPAEPALLVATVRTLVRARTAEDGMRRSEARFREIYEQRADMLEREQAARVAAERLSRSKDELIAVLSHELRTPLNAILTWVHVLQRGDSARNLEKGLAAIERNAQAQRRLISDMLDMSRMDLGKLHLELEPVDLTELVRYSVDVLDSLLREKSLVPTLEVAGTPQPLMADRARLQQVLWNLLTNAIKFSDPGGRLTVSLLYGPDEATITVRDEGQGIKPEFLPHLFDRFSQSDAATNRRHGGLGLGLSIVQQLAELHGGTVTAHSEGLGQGAAFVVRLPTRHAQATPTAPLLTEAEQVRHIEPLNLAHLRIVVVEDDADAREILGMILQNHGAAVRLATGYEQALALIDESMPDLLVSDIGMPGQDGYDLIREIRRREQVAGADRLPAIALTAFARARDVETALAHGFDVHCAKPLRVHDLLATILRVTEPAWRPTQS